MNVPLFPHRRRGNSSGIPEKLVVSVGRHPADFGLGPMRRNSGRNTAYFFQASAFCIGFISYPMAR